MLYCHVRGRAQEGYKLMILKYILQQQENQKNCNTSIVCMCMFCITFDSSQSLIIYYLVSWCLVVFFFIVT